MHAKIDRAQADRRPNRSLPDGWRHSPSFETPLPAPENKEFRGVTFRQMRAYEEMYPPLEEREFVRLARLAQAGSEDAMETIIKHHARKIMLFAIQAHTGRRTGGKQNTWGAASAGILTLDECIAIVTAAICEAVMRFKEGTYSPIAQAPVRLSSWVNLIILQRVSAEIRAAKHRLDHFEDEPDFSLRALENSLDANVRVSEGPETIVARERLWEIVTRIAGEDGRKVLEEWTSKMSMKDRAVLRPAYRDVIAKLRDEADPQELEALRKALSTHARR